jgi:hypothetical protein
MTVCILTLTAGCILAFLGRLMVYCTKWEAWLMPWAYGAYALAALLALTFVYNVILSIYRGLRRKQTHKGTMPKARQKKHKPPHR